MIFSAEFPSETQEILKEMDLGESQKYTANLAIF